jgi:hypothetical protein
MCLALCGNRPDCWLALWVFGINIEALAEEHLISFLEQNDLTLAKFEPIGKEDEKGRLDGGLVLAVND